MSKLRSKFITALAVLFCTLLLLSTAFIIPKTEKPAKAAATTTLKNDIVNETTHLVNDSGLKELFTALSGSATYSAVEDLFKVQSEYTAAVLTNKKGSEYNVLFGGEKWIPAYLSRTNGTTGDIILTLWLAESSDESVWSKHNNPLNTTYTTAYPSSMYSTSFIRAYINGTQDGDGNAIQYSTKYSSDAELKSATSNGDNAYSSKWVKFISDYSKYIVTPSQVSWQGTQSAYVQGVHGESCFFNDAYDTPTGNNWKDTVTPNFISSHKDVYTQWKADKLWIASATEASENGLWKLSSSQQSNTKVTATRSGGASKASVIFYIPTNGGAYNYYNDETAASNTRKYAVRPAFHLSLTKLIELAPEDIETTYTGSELNIPDIYTSASDEAPWYNITVYPSEVDYTYKLGNSVSSVLNVGNYTAELSLKSTSTTGYKWAQPDSPNGSTKTINIKVNKKPVKVKFTSQEKITSGVESEYPTVTYENNQLAADDGVGGKREATHYPKLQIRYINADSLTKSYDSTVKPTLPGKYIAIAEIDEKDANENNKIINYEIITDGGADRISFEVTPIEVKNPTYSGSLTYSGLEQTVNLENKDGLTDGLIKYTVTKKNGAVVTEKDGKKLEDITDDSFKVFDSGEYTVTFTFVDKDVKDTHVWKDSGKNDDYKLTVNVAKKTLEFTLDGGAEFTNNSWKAQTATPFTVKIVGECEQEKVELIVTHTDKEGVTETILTDQGDRNYIIPALDTGTKYKLYCKLSDADVNKNYEIKYNGNVVERIEKAFVVTAAQVSFNSSNLVWVYVNSAVEGGDEQSIVSGDEVTYNGKEFTIALKSNELTQYGLMVDTDFAPPTGFDGELKGTDVGTYTVKVRIKAVSADYNFPAQVFTFEWKIKKATYDLSTVTKLEWSYRARGSEMGKYPSGGIEYEGGQKVGGDGYIEIYVSGGLPTGLTVETIVNNGKYEIGTYTAQITKLKNSDSNYEDVDPAEYGWASFEWNIIKRAITTDSWSEAKYENCKVTDPPELDPAPYNSVKLRYEFYATADCSGEGLKFDGENNELTYEEGKTKTYWVKVFIDENDSYSFDNFYIDPDKNTYEFTVGEVKIAVEITVKAGGVYDGEKKPIEIKIVGNVPGIDVNAFEITYYNKANNSVALDGAPTDAGSYRAVIALKAGYTKYYIDSPKTYEFTIDTRVLDIPEYEDNLTYDGTEQDVAKIVRLPDGWENYIVINIKSLTAGIPHPAGSTIKVVADYEVSFSIKDGVNTGTPNNVQWSDDTKTPKKLKISIVKLVLHAEGWAEAEYDSYIVFTENNGRNFVVYTVTDIDGKVVDKATVEASENESFTVTVAVAEEHGNNVEIVFTEGVSHKYEFFTNAGLPPVKVTLPKIADMTFNGENQTFVVDYGEFEEYIEIDLSLSDASVLSQFNAGEYTVYFKIKSGKNAVWADTGDRKSIAVTFIMKVLVLEEPQVKTGERFTYSGSEQSATLNIDAAILARFMTIEGDYTATNAGDYTFTLLIDPSFAGNVVWAGTDETKTVDWTIEKAKLSVKWTQSGDVPELDIPEEFKDLDVEYVITDESGNVVTPDQMEAGKTYTVTAKLKEGSASNYEFVDESGKPLTTPTATEGFGFEYIGGGSSFPWWILAVVAGLLILAIVVIIVIKKRQVADGEEDFGDYYGDDYDYDEEDFEEDDFSDDEDY